MQEDFKLDWSTGVYTIRWASGRISEVLHISGVTADVREYTVMEERGRRQPLRRHGVFKSNKRPFAQDFNHPT